MSACGWAADLAKGSVQISDLLYRIIFKQTRAGVCMCVACVGRVGGSTGVDERARPLRIYVTRTPTHLHSSTHTHLGSRGPVGGCLGGQHDQHGAGDQEQTAS